MAFVKLTVARIRALWSGRSAHGIRDAKLKGCGVQVLPAGGKRYFVHLLMADAKRVQSDRSDCMRCWIAIDIPFFPSTAEQSSHLPSVHFGNAARFCSTRLFYCHVDWQGTGTGDVN